MSLEIKIKAEDIEELGTWFELIDQRLKFASFEEQEKLKMKLAKVMSEEMDERFASAPATTQGGYVQGGVFWKPLSESYLAQRPERKVGRIYKDTGELMRSFNINSPNLVSTFDGNNTYQFGSSIPYAKDLQSVRQIVYFYDDLLEKLAFGFMEWLIELPEDTKLETKGDAKVQQ